MRTDSKQTGGMQIKDIAITKEIMRIDTRTQAIDMQQIDNRRFLYNPDTGVLVLGRQYAAASLTDSSHAVELADAGITKDFDDFVTVIYGHNGYSDTFFTTLHYFEKKEFFNSHPYFYIYTPKRKLTYQVISAFKYDNRHILNSFDFNKEASIKEWQDTITNPTSSLKNVRKNLDVPLSINSKIVVLSTCITNQRNNRYLVCGELVKDEKTN